MLSSQQPTDKDASGSHSVYMYNTVIKSKNSVIDIEAQAGKPLPAMLVPIRALVWVPDAPFFVQSPASVLEKEQRSAEVLGSLPAT